MCGRFTLRAPASVVAEQFALFEVADFEPRFNIAPSQPVAVVRAAATGSALEREFAWLRWGLIPSWASDPAVGHRMINARAETAPEKPAFRAAFRRRRCLVVADGFYEWQRAAAAKQPYFLRMRDDRPFAFAGLWESWEGPDHGAVESCTILTTEANPVVRPIHDRMPVILAPADYGRWLDPAVQRPEELRGLLRPHAPEAMMAYAVDRHVNHPAHEGPRCIEPVR